MRKQIIAIVFCIAVINCQFLNTQQQQASTGYRSEYKPQTKTSKIINKTPIEYTAPESLPQAWSWDNVNGTSYITKSLNQHIPQYCGSCWAHGALSALADRIKIARKGKGADINLSIQYILNCGTAGSCHGGDHLAVYQFIHQKGFVPYDTCLQYEACSSESTEGNCAGRSAQFQCNAMNTCRTCSTFKDNGGVCNGLNIFPNATVAEYGSVRGADAIKAEIYRRGPVAAGINAEPILEYQGGIFDDETQSQGINHIISIIGWGYDEDTKRQYWIIRNSWGEYWGELGYVRVAMGKNILGIEADAAWATPGIWTEKNFGCFEDGSNCVGKYTDPAVIVKEFAETQ